MGAGELVRKAINTDSRPFYRLPARTAIRERPSASLTVWRNCARESQLSARGACAIAFVHLQSKRVAVNNSTSTTQILLVPSNDFPPCTYPRLPASCTGNHCLAGRQGVATLNESEVNDSIRVIVMTVRSGNNISLGLRQGHLPVAREIERGLTNFDCSAAI